MLTNARLVFRADGNQQVGLGHLMRLMALAEIAGATFERLFVVRPDLPPSTHNELVASGVEVVVLPPIITGQEEAQWLVKEILRPTDTVVLDGYDFSFAYQTTIRAAIGALLYVDDIVSFPQAADVVLNPAGGVEAARYDLRRPGARVLVGPAWAPLRAPFREAAVAPPEAAPTDCVLLCLGGSDLPNRTHQLAQQLALLPGVTALHVVVGSAYAHHEQLATWAAALASERVFLHQALSAAKFCYLLQACGTALLSASTVSYEYASSGGGLLALIQTADNQQSIYQFMLREGLARPAAALPNMFSAPDRSHTQALLRAAQRRYFDGQAPTRLFGLLRSLSAQATLHLRPATVADSARLLQWANDPVVRHFSYRSATITTADHERWLAARLTDPHHLLLVSEVAGQPAGTIRFALDASTGTATLSFLVAPEFRGIGLAPLVLRAGVQAAKAHWPALTAVIGHVQTHNNASLAAFRRAGFTERNNSITPPDSVSFEYRLT
jgi:UDP-2,4-diacetamido-2,4,6-trideoxy-beta-L-altropyranose hydrolase